MLGEDFAPRKQLVANTDDTRLVIGEIVMCKQPEPVMKDGVITDELSDEGRSTAANIREKLGDKNITLAEACDTNRSRKALAIILESSATIIQTEPLLNALPPMDHAEYVATMKVRVAELIRHFKQRIREMMAIRMQAANVIKAQTLLMITHSHLVEKMLEKLLKSPSAINSVEDIVGIFKPGQHWSLEIAIETDSQTNDRRLVLMLKHNNKHYELTPEAFTALSQDIDLSQ